MQKLIIEAAINEQAPKSDNPNVPYTVEECVREAIASADAGAAIVHPYLMLDQGLDISPPPSGDGQLTDDDLLPIASDVLDMQFAYATEQPGIMALSTAPTGWVRATYVTDSNANRTAVTYTPGGLVAATAVMGKTGETIGDTVDVPGLVFSYDLFAFVERQEPASVHVDPQDRGREFRIQPDDEGARTVPGATPRAQRPGGAVLQSDLDGLG